MQEERRFYSERQGRGPKVEAITIDQFKRLVFATLDTLREADIFYEAFGHDCVDGNGVPGVVGSDPNAYFLRKIRRDDVWPYRIHGDMYDADTLLDVLEVLHDVASLPLEAGSYYHSWNDCGWHYNHFDRQAGQAQFRDELNAVLRMCDPPLECQANGHIVEATPDEFRPLISADVPAGTEEIEVTARILAATSRFRDRHASVDDRRQAVRDLADVLEFLRPTLKQELLSADESDLFNIANNFAIRHNNPSQKRDYDSIIWLRWMFYVYLATIHAVLRVRDRLAKSNEAA